MRKDSNYREQIMLKGIEYVEKYIEKEEAYWKYKCSEFGSDYNTGNLNGVVTCKEHIKRAKKEAKQ